jgi:hypothetical protein
VSDALPGAAGSGSITAYTVPAGYLLRLELLRFTLATDATAGVHKARVTIRDVRSGYVTATLRDLNEGGPSMTLTYTYGIGLDGSACAAVDGWEMTDALPDTVLAPQTTVTLAAVDEGGSVIAGDTFSNVVLYGDLVDEGGFLRVFAEGNDGTNNGIWLNASDATNGRILLQSDERDVETRAGRDVNVTADRDCFTRAEGDATLRAAGGGLFLRGGTSVLLGCDAGGITVRAQGGELNLVIASGSAFYVRDSSFAPLFQVDELGGLHGVTGQSLVFDL